MYITVWLVSVQLSLSLCKKAASEMKPCGVGIVSYFGKQTNTNKKND